MIGNPLSDTVRLKIWIKNKIKMCWWYNRISTYVLSIVTWKIKSWCDQHTTFLILQYMLYNMIPNRYLYFFPFWKKPPEASSLMTVSIKQPRQMWFLDTPYYYYLTYFKIFKWCIHSRPPCTSLLWQWLEQSCLCSLMCQNLTDNDVKPFIWWKRKRERERDKENREGKRENRNRERENRVRG